MVNDKTRDAMREQFEYYAEEKIGQIAAQLSGQMSRELIELQKMYPKRRLLFQDIMGSVTISVEVSQPNSNTLEHGGAIWMPVNWLGQEYEGKFDEHHELMDWYNEQSSQFNIGIDPITIKPLKKR